MKLVAVSVFDAKSGAFSNPQFFRSNGEAVRSFIDACQNDSSQFHKHLSDYSFWKVGEFEDTKGEFKPDLIKLMEAIEALPSVN